jgi:glycyl-tRNA synthetase beta chain
MENKEIKSPSPVTGHSSLLLEIGTEEIPARFLPPALTMLRDNASSIFSEHSIDHPDIRTYATPRRLALIVKGMPPVQKDMVKEVTGPPKKAAFDENGKPTKAAIGFAGSQGIDVSQLSIKKTDKGEYIAAVIRQKGIPVKELLPEVLSRIILSLHFPKSMRWGSGNLRFVRPIHWILALYGEETIHFDIDGIKSGNITKGHRFLSPGSFSVKEVPTYIHLLENNYVIADQDKRKKLIVDGLDSISSSINGVALKDKDLLETVIYLVEYPVPVLCEFPSEYLGLPKELLVTVMKDHQKYFAVEDSSGKLRNHFIVISNTKNENSEMIKTGAERVIKARFEDARFYYEEDMKKPLHKRVDDLKRVTFHDKLGNLYDKTARMVDLSLSLSDKLFPDKRNDIERAARLCKTDLITGVVGEFPELQGLMGRYYALHDGETDDVANAIMQHYKPSCSGDSIPETDEGCILSLSDKIDNLASFFNINIVPTGSEDPFALRRQAIAIIAILLEKEYDITLREMLDKAGRCYADRKSSLTDDVLNFFMQRIEPLLSARDYEPDMVQSVIHLAGDIPLNGLIERLDSIKRFATRGEYNSFLVAVKRVNNIIPGTEIPPMRQALLIESQEKALCNDIMDIKPKIHELSVNKRYDDALSLLTTLTGSINNFFDGVLVMDKRDEIRLNRLALLKEIWSTVSAFADFSKLKER